MGYGRSMTGNLGLRVKKQKCRIADEKRLAAPGRKRSNVLRFWKTDLDRDPDRGPDRDDQIPYGIGQQHTTGYIDQYSHAHSPSIGREEVMKMVKLS